jgi:hypothetical protein
MDKRSAKLAMSNWAGRLRNHKDATALPVEADELAQDDLDDFVARNRDSLNQSIRRSREEVAAGAVASRTIEDIIKDGRLRHRRS